MASAILKQVAKKLPQWFSMAMLGYEVREVVEGREVKVIEKYEGISAEKVHYEHKEISAVDILVLVLVILIIATAVIAYISRVCMKYNSRPVGRSGRRIPHRRIPRNGSMSSELNV